MRCLLSLLLLVPYFFSANVNAQKQFGFDNRKSSGQPYLKPEETVAKMKVADGFEVKLFAGEPQLVNPIAMTVDEKGRVWVIECFEYPKRTEKGKMPRDRIVILEDTDGDGVCDKRTVFAEGKDFPVSFDMASGLEVGYGGVWVGAPPYMFFIENKNDKPGKFEILLKGFGSQDTHETLNTFQWGPDGWLYGLHGIYTQSEIIPYGAAAPKAEAEAQRGIKMNAAVWRLHPKTKKFEIFSEGTSNPWGMDWRNTDGQFILCCCVIPHLYHMVPGGIYKRQGGQSFNPYAYGEIKEICDHTFHKESGWAHAGLISLDTPIMPEKYRNSVIFGSIHGCSIKQNILKPNGSTYTASRGDDFLVSGDKNFRPINLRWGPNGEIYCIDWHDQNPCHQAAADSWDYERGRVYTIQPKGLKTKKAEDLAARDVLELVSLYKDPNPYRARTATRLLAERFHDKKFENKIDDATVDSIRETPDDVRAILMRLSAVADIRLKLDEVDMGLTLQNPIIRVWFARQLREKRLDNPSAIIAKCAAYIETEKSPIVRREFASAASSLLAHHDVSSFLRALLRHAEDANDPIIPHLLWLAYEKQLIKDRSDELDWLRNSAKDNAMICDYMLPRVMRRLVATGKSEDLMACVRFVHDVKDSTAKQRSLEGLVEAFKGRQVDAPAGWKEARLELLKENKEIQALTNKLAINFRDADAIKKALAIAQDAKAAMKDRLDAIRDLGLAKPQAALDPLLKIAKSEEVNELRVEAIRALASFDGAVGKVLLADYPKLPRNLKGEIINVLAGRKEWAKELLDAVGKKIVERTDLNDNTILRIQALKDKDLDAQIDKVWGRLRATPAELNALIDKTRNQLHESKASFARGKIAFDNHCAKCHKFDGRGYEVGPSIEGAERSIEYLLINVLDPNRVIGAPYFMRTVTKLNGQTEIGVLHAEDETSITLKTENAVLKVIPKKDIEEVRVQEKSLMPEGFGSNIKEQEFRDLIRYVMANPFITEVEVAVSPPKFRETINKTRPVVGVPGRIPIPDGEFDVVINANVSAPEAVRTRILLGVRSDFTLQIGGKKYTGKGSGADAQPDQVSIDVELNKGENPITIEFHTKGKNEAVYARFHDPDRKLGYPEPKE